MTLPIDTLDHHVETFRIPYDEHLTCRRCDESWEVTAPDDTDEPVLTAPTGPTGCPGCGAASGHEYRKRTHYSLEFGASPAADPPLSVDAHACALRRLAREFEALAAHGWRSSNPTRSTSSSRRSSSRPPTARSRCPNRSSDD